MQHRRRARPYNDVYGFIRDIEAKSGQNKQELITLYILLGALNREQFQYYFSHHPLKIAAYALYDYCQSNRAAQRVVQLRAHNLVEEGQGQAMQSHQIERLKQVLDRRLQEDADALYAARLHNQELEEEKVRREKIRIQIDNDFQLANSLSAKDQPKPTVPQVNANNTATADQSVRTIEQSVEELTQFNQAIAGLPELIKSLKEIKDTNADLVRDKIDRLLKVQATDAHLVRVLHNTKRAVDKKFPSQCPISLDDITEEKLQSGEQFVMLDGHAYDLRAFVEAHNKREGGMQGTQYETTIYREGGTPGKYLRDPLTNLPYDDKSVAHVQSKIKEFNKKNPATPLKLERLKGYLDEEQPVQTATRRTQPQQTGRTATQSFAYSESHSLFPRPSYLPNPNLLAAMSLSLMTDSVFYLNVGSTSSLPLLFFVSLQVSSQLFMDQSFEDAEVSFRGSSSRSSMRIRC